jgi:uncharacterized protein (TIRG00374 family)
MRAPRWQLIVSIALTCGVLVLAYVKRDRIWSSFELLREAQPAWLLLAVALEIFSFFCASQVYYRVLRSLGYHFSALRLWMIALVAIILSQSVPAGGVASYAFIVQTFRRRGVSGGHAALTASLEALSYAGAMLLLFGFSLGYLTLRSGFGAAEDASLVAALVAVLVIGGALFILTREQEVLTRWLLGIKNGVARLLGRSWSDAPIHKIVDDLARGRALVAARRSEILLLVLIQLSALAGHSLAMLVVLRGLGATTSVFVVLAAFGIALITSTFNVLPGGGGTVEAVLVFSLTQLGVGEQAYVAAPLFRLLNFWLLLPVAAIAYRLLMHGSAPDEAPLVESKAPLVRD